MFSRKGGSFSGRTLENELCVNCLHGIGNGKQLVCMKRTSHAREAIGIMYCTVAGVRSQSSISEKKKICADLQFH